MRLGIDYNDPRGSIYVLLKDHVDIWVGQIRCVRRLLPLPDCSLLIKVDVLPRVSAKEFGSSLLKQEAASPLVPPPEPQIPVTDLAGISAGGSHLHPSPD